MEVDGHQVRVAADSDAGRLCRARPTVASRRGRRQQLLPPPLRNQYLERQALHFQPATAARLKGAVHELWLGAGDGRLINDIAWD